MNHDPYLTESREFHIKMLGTPSPMENGWRTKYLFRPERVSISWVSVERGPWQLVSVKIKGPKLKKDGTDSLNPAHKTWYGAIPTDAPGWLLTMIDGYRPEDYS